MFSKPTLIRSDGKGVCFELRVPTHRTKACVTGTDCCGSLLKAPLTDGASAA